MFDRIVSAVARRLEDVIGLILGVMVVLVFGNVVLRYGFNSGITISEEASRYLFIWLTFIGAVVALYEREHLGVDSLVRALPRGGKVFCAVASNLLMLLATVLLFYGSWKQTLITLHNKSPVSGIPLAFIYVAGLLSSFMMGVVILRNLHRLGSGRAGEEDLNLSVESEDLPNVDHAATALLVNTREPDSRALPSFPPGAGK